MTSSFSINTVLLFVIQLWTKASPKHCWSCYLTFSCELLNFFNQVVKLWNFNYLYVYIYIYIYLCIYYIYYIYIYIYNIYNDVMKTIQCAHPHHHNAFMATCRLWMANGGVHVLLVSEPTEYSASYNKHVIYCLLYFILYIYIRIYIYI